MDTTPVTWLDQLVGAKPVTMPGALVRAGDYDPVELADMFRALAAHPYRELVISMHQTPNAAKVARRRRRGSPRWHRDGVMLHTRKVVGDWTAVTAVYKPTVDIHVLPGEHVSVRPVPATLKAVES